MFIMVDGIDGSGKSTVIDAWKAYLAQNKKICSLKSFWQGQHRHPRPEEITDCDIIFSAEPTFVGIGKEIREHLIQTSEASPESLAQAYSKDRQVLYTDVLIPLITTHTIIQDRGISTSLCYQPLHASALTADYISTLPGNALALHHAPNHLVIVDTPAAVAITRLGGREKQDNAVFEKEQFLNNARERFLAPSFQQFFLSRGTHIHILNGNTPLDIMTSEAINLLNRLL